MSKQEQLYQVQKFNFAAYDMLLYLDTHPEDRKAFKMFKELVEKLKKMISAYESQYGPLTPYSSASFNEFTWLDSPWPWEREGNK